MDYFGVMFENLFSRSGLSLDRLRSFLQVAEAGSIVKAAQGDPVRQSLISRQIRELEEFFGAELTERRGKAIAISPAGERLAGLIREQLQDLDDFRREQAKLKKSFAIGSGASILEWLVVPAVNQIAQCLGGASLRLETHRSRDLVEAVREGRVDLAVVREDALNEDHPRLKLMRIEFRLCVPRLLVPGGLGARILRPEYLKPLPFAAVAGEGQFAQVLRQAMAELGMDFHPTVECHSHLQVRELVARGHHAGVLPSVGTKDLDEGVISIQAFPPLRHYGRQLVLHWNERQMRRRGIEERAIREVAKAIMA